jgi:Domain of unknown function (DUF4301)
MRYDQPMAHFTEAQKSQLRERGISEDEANRQLALVAAPIGYADVVRPCRLGDGIEAIPDDRQDELIALHEEAARQGRCSKFVPASGAATRMFQDVLTGRGVDALLTGLDRLAFADDVRAELAFRGYDLDVLKEAGSGAEVVDALLGADGLGYATIPKGLVPFHRYANGARTAFEEHLVEAAGYVRDDNGVCRVRFTVSPEHLHAFRLLAERVVPAYERTLGVRFELAFSVQKSATDTVAGSPGGGPFIADDGSLVLRPSGHGALLENLAEAPGDLVFIKNIDNVQTEALRADTLRWKKILGGRLVELQRAVFVHVARLRSRPVNPECAAQAEEFAQSEFGLAARGPAGPPLFERPIRVCGVVRNTGEPGGGPYWMRTRDGRVTRQIVEAGQIDPASEAQRAVLREATHFNPVDLVCGLLDVSGHPFALREFVDPRAVMISGKSQKGRDLLALERPGLWNGAMAEWITVFVEVPISTFTPVKTVADLLRPEHQ